MTLAANSRLAGAAFLLYIAAGIGGMAAAGMPVVRGVLTALLPFCAIALGVTLYALTRAVDRDLALLAMACRLVEASGAGSGELFFAAGSTIFCWLFVAGRLIPRALAWLGLLSSAFVVALQFLQAGGMFGGKTNWASPLTWAAWFPLLIFELAVAVWLLTRGVSPRAAAGVSPGPIQPQI
jgi:hypothetical protein